MGAQVIQIDLGALHGGGDLVQTALFDIKVFHQSHPVEPIAGVRALEELDHAHKHFEDAVLAFQLITRAHQTDERFLLKLEFQCAAMFD
jgi:hypothetical protein